MTTAGIAALAVSGPAFAQQDERGMEDGPQRCVSSTVLVPPFNNSPAALEQSRYAATTVEEIRHRRGEEAVRVCRKSALAPELSEIQGVDEEPLTDEEYEVLENSTADADDAASDD